MTTSESHGAISGSRVSDARLAEIATSIEEWGETRSSQTSSILSALRELISLRSEPSEPVAWLNPDNGAIARQRTRNNIIPLYASPQPGASS